MSKEKQIRIYTFLKDHAVKNGKKNFLTVTVPAAIKELEKIEVTQQTDHNYRLDHAVTRTQKEILAFINGSCSEDEDEN